MKEGEHMWDGETRKGGTWRKRKRRQMREDNSKLPRDGALKQLHSPPPPPPPPDSPPHPHTGPGGAGTRVLGTDTTVGERRAGLVTHRRHIQIKVCMYAYRNMHARTHARTQGDVPVRRAPRCRSAPCAAAPLTPSCARSPGRPHTLTHTTHAQLH